MADEPKPETLELQAADPVPFSNQPPMQLAEISRRAAHRPSTYTTEIAASICEALSIGMPTRDIAKLPGFPGASTIFRWIAEIPEFQVAYDAAIAWRIESDMDWLMEIALDKSEDFKNEPTGKDSLPARVFDKTAVSRSELACKMLQWRIMKRAPKYRDPVPNQQIITPAQPGQPQPGDNARLIGHSAAEVIENPMGDAIAKWRKQKAEMNAKPAT